METPKGKLNFFNKLFFINSVFFRILFRNLGSLYKLGFGVDFLVPDFVSNL